MKTLTSLLLIHEAFNVFSIYGKPKAVLITYILFTINNQESKVDFHHVVMQGPEIITDNSENVNALNELTINVII